MTGITTATERTIDVKDIDPRHRHTIIQQLLEHLAPGACLQLVVDHDPKPLRFQLEAKHGARCQWTDDAERIYLESLVREDYDRCHPGETFDDMKLRIPFSKEDRGLYQDWLAVAAARDAALTAEHLPLIAAE